MSSPSVTSASQPRVPAWKRIGLKLKYAKETADIPATNPARTASSANDFALQSTNNATADIPQHDHEDAPRPAKKRKAFTNGSPEPLSDHGIPTITSAQTVRRKEPTESEQTLSVRQSKRRTSPHKSSLQRADSRRKSVTFTEDTKVDDGFSAQQLFKDWVEDDDTANQGLIDAWEASEAGKANSRIDPEPVEVAQPVAEPTKLDCKNQKQKQKSLPASTNSPSTDTVVPGEAQTIETSEYVRYLEQYYTDKDHWKFNKNKQKDVLKNIFNIHRIPAKHNEAIFAYVSGLQGAAAQQRVLDEAEEVLKALLMKQNCAEEVEGVDSRVMRRNAYHDAFEREWAIVSKVGRSEHDDQTLEEMRREAERLKRADVIFSELLEKALAPPPAPIHVSTPPTPTTLPTTAVPSGKRTTFENDAGDTGDQPAKPSSRPITKKRKRKARTDVSSSSSDSDSSSESEGE
ncbi:hypothetical protein LTR78_001448 [Recurvomyces mirabilis]|uniref:WKF domain-containing protein n=1 Tax=Recurvomyces mirabilis TaxID=574656 RepID=A0AAE0WVQ6_9PEZI|nr:hypothetical protein LTR78_001448 [Recurvomyces mirabilis]KAK5161425.1 hypothetical protein LTS14_001221 [Recurvomyces mirabilis]